MDDLSFGYLDAYSSWLYFSCPGGTIRLKADECHAVEQYAVVVFIRGSLLN